MAGDDDEDLSKLDRGDNVDEDTDDTEEKPDDAKRDKKGRFTSDKEKGAADKEGDDAEDDDAADAGEGEGEEGEEGEEEEGEAAVDDDKQNFPIRLNKAKDQRDRARAERDAERAARVELEEELRRVAPAPAAPAAASPTAAIEEELEAMYEVIEEMRLDGKTKEAATLQRQIDAKNRELARIEAETIVPQQVARATEDQRYDAMIDYLENSIDILNPQHEDYEKKVADEIEFQTKAYEKMGMAPTAALKRATAVVFRVDVFAPRQAAKEAPKEGLKKKGPDVGKAIDHQKRQPPDASDRGVQKDLVKINVTTLSEEDFDKLPESKKKQLRGDNV